MKLSFLFLVVPAAMVGSACGSNTSGDDAGGSDAAGDATTNDGSSSDGSPSDAASDGASDAAKDGSLGSGDECDTNDDQCGAGLKCCAGGATNLDGGNGHCVVPKDGGICPAVP